MRGVGRRIALAMMVLAMALGAGADPAKGPLRVHPENARYFTDGSKGPDGALRAVYLTGSHTWNSLVDMGRNDPPEKFDFEAYLVFLEKNGHNFVRLWAWDSTVWDTKANGKLGKVFVHHCGPLPWARTGAGKALDGKAKFDLGKFNDEYFKRLRERVKAAGEREIYVSVMLFEGWGLYHGNRGRAAAEGWAWRSHPFHPENNVNGIVIEGAEKMRSPVHRLGNTEVNEIQAAYIRKVVDTVNDFDNVLYEVINEGGEKEWDWWVVRTIKEYEKTKAKQHPVGITGHGAERLASMLASPADWISPGRADGYAENPPAWEATHGKVSLLDTDHIWGVGGDAGWVWRSMTRGHNPIFMDPWDGSVLGRPGDKQFDRLRKAMGQARKYAERMNLAKMGPANAAASSGYCLSDGKSEFLVYVPKGGAVTVDVTGVKGEMTVEWFDPKADRAVAGKAVAGGAKRELKPPLEGEMVLYLKL